MSCEYHLKLQFLSGRNALLQQRTKTSHLTELDHLVLTIGAPDILSVDLLWGQSAKSSVAESSAVSLAPESTSAKLRFPEATPLLLTQMFCCSPRCFAAPRSRPAVSHTAQCKVPEGHTSHLS